MTRLRNRLLVPTAGIASVTGLTLAFLAHEASVQAAALERELSQTQRATALAFELTTVSDEEQRRILSFEIRPEEQMGPRVEESERSVARLMREVASLPLAERASATWAQYAGARAALLRVRDEFLSASRRRDVLASEVAFARFSLVTERANALLASFAAFHQRGLERAVAKLEQRRAHAYQLAAGALVGALAFSVALSLLLARGVVRPIVEMARTAERIADRGLAETVRGTARPDEIGVLARAFDRMTRRLFDANVRLLAAVRTRDDFISIASHELRTPLTPLALQVQSLTRLARRKDGALTGDARIVEGIGRLDRHVARLTKLVENLLDMSRIASGRLTLRVAEVDVAGLLAGVVEKTREALSQAGCGLEVESSFLGSIQADPTKLQQVLVNLLTNAAKYAAGRPVALRTRGTDDGLVIEVEDRGSGIAPADQERIFGRFERAVPDGYELPGLGLGLFVAREIVRAHGGEIAVQSAVGEGSTFVVSLPEERREPRTGEGELAM